MVLIGVQWKFINTKFSLHRRKANPPGTNGMIPGPSKRLQVLLFYEPYSDFINLGQDCRRN